MPYNLRKRKEPPAAEAKPVEAKKPRGRAKKAEPEKPADKPAEPEVEDRETPMEEDETEVKVIKKPAAKKAKKADLEKPVEKLVEAKTEDRDTPMEQDGNEVEVNNKPAVKKAKKAEPVKKEKAVAKAKVEVKETVVEQDGDEDKQADKKPPAKKLKTEECNQFVFGSDLGGELGLGKIGCDKKNPTPIALKERVKQVACGAMHTISLTESGQVYSYGCNDDGALGRVTDGDETLEATPTLVELENKVTKITAGDSHCAALTDTHEVYIWGNLRDENGMVGLLQDCDGRATFTPTKVNLAKKLKDIASGANHLLLLDVDGVVYSFGVGDHGQLGRLKPEECAKKLNAETGEMFLTPKPVDLRNVDPQRPFICDAVFAGEYTSFATNTDKKKNRTAGWGLNNYYQLGYKGQKGQLDQHYPRRCTFTCSTSMINVVGGQHHTIFLTKTGRVYAAGRHEYGMLGIGKSMSEKKEICPAAKVDAFENPIITICAGSRTSFAVDDQGKLYSWGMNSLNLGVDGDDDLTKPTLVAKLAGKEVVAVASGSITSVIVK